MRGLVRVPGKGPEYMQNEAGVVFVQCYECWAQRFPQVVYVRVEDTVRDPYTGERSGTKCWHSIACVGCQEVPGEQRPDAAGAHLCTACYASYTSSLRLALRAWMLA
jgi:hypothetical protein